MRVTRREFVGGATAGVVWAAAASGEEEPWDLEADVVVVGAGTGLAGALAAAVGGARVLVLEKRPATGGTTALSGGVAWVPNNHKMAAEGIADSRADALAYVRHLSGGQADDEVIEAFVDGAPRMAAFVEEHSPIRWRVSQVMGAVADYHPEWKGAVLRGRSIEPTVEQPGLYGRDLVRGLEDGAKRSGAEIRLQTAVERLVMRGLPDGRREVLGVAGRAGARALRVKARRGVLLAAGGFEWNFEMKQHFLRGPSPYPLGVSTNTGDGIRMAMAAGADLRNMNEVWGITVYKPEAEEAQQRGAGASLLAQIEKRSPGCIAVNRFGERFQNEAADYDSTWRSYLGWDNYGALGYRHLPAFHLFDSKVRRGATIAGARADQPLPGWVSQAQTLPALAEALGIDPEGLERSVAFFNEHARQGRDPLFRRGESAYDRRAETEAASTLAALDEPPFYGVEVAPGDLGTCGGPRVNRHAQVLDPFGEAIPRLYASGNNAGVGSPGASYGGGGGTIGPALTFAFLAGGHAASLPPWERG